MIPYILYASLILTACLIFYKLLLQKETFFRLNRFILLACMVLAFTLPLIHVPQQISLRKSQNATNITITSSPVYQQHTVSSAEKSVSGTIVETVQKNTSLNFEQVAQWLIYLYWFGVILFALNFLMQAALLLYKAYSRPAIMDGRFRIVEISGDKAPCSFGNNIFINPEKYDWETYSQVLLHEKIHIEQRHTLDLLLAEIVLIFQWFNPFAWQWRKELENNLEFFTDDKLLQHNTVEKESYQLSLLKVAAPHFPLSLTTNYNQSLLKKRLLMMNSKKSNVHTIWKYFFLLPLMVLFVCFFNETSVTSQSLSSKTKQQPDQHSDNSIKSTGSWTATISKDKINIEFKNDGEDHSSNSNTYSLSEFNNLPKDGEGMFTMVREAGTMEFTGKFSNGQGMGKYKFVADKTYNDDMHKEGIDISKDNDAMAFFFVNVKRSYVQMLKKKGYSDLDKDKVIPLAALDIDEAYITSIQEAGFKDISLENLIPFRAMNIDKAYIEEIRNAGYTNFDADKVIGFKAQGIDGKYLADIHNSLKNNKEDKENNDQARADNNNKNEDHNTGKNKNNEKEDKDDDDDIIAFKAMNIDNAYINSFKAAGYNNLSSSELLSFKAVGVTPEYAQSFKKAGFNNVDADNLVALKSQNITPTLIKEYKDLGFENVSLDDVIGAKATGTSPSFIKSMQEKGHHLKSLDKYIALKSVLKD